MSATNNSAVEAILTARFPYRSLIQLGEGFARMKEGYQFPPEVRAQIEAIEAARAELLALPEPELQRQYVALLADQAAKRKADEVAKLERAEAQRFYHQPDSQADFGYWMSLEYWTVDEAAALLPGKDPIVVNPRTLEREVDNGGGQSASGLRAPFVRRFHTLLHALQRARNLGGDQLRAKDVARWAVQANVTDLPEPLKALLEENPTAGSRPKEVRWTPEKLAELSTYRDKHGIAAAAAHYGVSQQRIRALLPRGNTTDKGMGYSVFKHRPK